MMNFREYQPEEIVKNYGHPIKVTYDYFQEKKKEFALKNKPISYISCAIMLYEIPETWNIDTPSSVDIEKVLVYGHLTNFIHNDDSYQAEVIIQSKVPGYEGKTIILNRTDQYDFLIYRFNSNIDPMYKIILGYRIVMDNNGDILQLCTNNSEYIAINI